jgi:hypothetical protein
MPDDLFIGIVPAPGSTEPTWIGTFKFDRVEGYTGQLLSKLALQPGFISTEPPSEINQDILFAILDGVEPGTIVWPRHSGRSIKSFVSQIVQTRIPNLVRGAHIEANERCILSVTLYSPVFALLFGLTGYTQQIRTEKPLKVTIESKNEKELEFDSKIGRCFVGVRQRFKSQSGNLTIIMDAIGYLRVELRGPGTLVDAIKLMYQLEQLFSLLCFSYIKCKDSGVKVRFSDGAHGQSDKNLSVGGPGQSLYRCGPMSRSLRAAVNFSAISPLRPE